MSGPVHKYMTSLPDTEDFIVFLTGMRINRPWKFWKWLPVFIYMPRMCRELMRRPELGMLHYRYHPGIRSMLVVQYWRSYEDLHRYATDKKSLHVPGWRWMNKHIGLNGDVGTWHETYVIRKNSHECLYVNMPEHGLAKAFGAQEATGNLRTGKGRMGKEADDWTDLKVEAAE
ncbi:MAG: transcriptional regulator [Ponticaulis sp.]|nr:transcriptional regulator [Ponticaulis sp.]